jgi:beta-lactamase class A
MSFSRTALFSLLALMLVACAGPTGAASSVQIPSVTPSQTAAVPVSTTPPLATIKLKTATSAVVPTATLTAKLETATATPTGKPNQSTATATSSPTATLTPPPTAGISTGTSSSTEELIVPPPNPTATQNSTNAELVAEISDLLEGRQGLYEVVVIGPGGETMYELNGDHQVQSASLYKLLIMVEVFRQIEDGVIALDDPVFMYSGFFKEAGFDDRFDLSYVGSTVTVEDLLYPMIAFSSNVAAFALLNLVGNANINQTAAELGMSASEIRWMPTLESGSMEVAPGTGLASYAGLIWQGPTADEAYNVTDADDTALLFRLLVEGQVVSPSASKSMLDLLAAQVVNDRLPALLPAGVVAHKTGNIDNVIHDVGVIYTPFGPFVTVVLTEDALEWQAVEFMQELALDVYEYGSR